MLSIDAPASASESCSSFACLRWATRSSAAVFTSRKLGPPATVVTVNWKSAQRSCCPLDLDDQGPSTCNESESSLINSSAVCALYVWSKPIQMEVSLSSTRSSEMLRTSGNFDLSIVSSKYGLIVVLETPK